MKLSNRVETMLRKEQEKQRQEERAKSRADKQREQIRAEVTSYRASRGLATNWR